MVGVDSKPLAHLSKILFGKGDAMLALSSFSELAQAPHFLPGSHSTDVSFMIPIWLSLVVYPLFMRVFYEHTTPA